MEAGEERVGEGTKEVTMMTSIKGFISRHPRISAWIALAVGMVIMLVIAARDVGLLPGQWVALVVTTILVAGLCVWIIYLE